MSRTPGATTTMAEFDEYRGPNMAVDVAVLTQDSDGLAVLVQTRASSPRGTVLPGRFLREGETVGVGLGTALRDKAGLDVGPVDATLDDVASEGSLSTPIRAHLVGVFDRPGRDRRSSWSMSLAHYVVLPHDRLQGARGEFIPVLRDGSVGIDLLFDHDAIVREAARHLRARYELTPDPDNLLGGDEITLPDLQDVHEAVLGERLRTDTFRRRMESLLDDIADPEDPTGKRRKTRPSGSRGGPPTRLWARRSISDGVTVGANRLLRLPRAGD